MSRKANILRLFIVAILLVAYSGVYITNILCSFEDETAVHSHQHSHKSKTNQHSKTATLDNVFSAYTHSDKNDDDDDCCKNLSSSFVSELPKSIASNVKTEIESFKSLLYIYSVSPLNYHSWHSQFTTYHYSLPPAIIIDIRVFIQSFII